jgi:hypothetical protein
MADTELLHGIGTVEVLDARVESIQISAVDAAGVDGLPLDLAAVRFDAVADIRVDIYGFSPHVNGGEVVQELADVRMELEIGSVADTSAGTLDEFAVVGPVQVEFELDV